QLPRGDRQIADDRLLDPAEPADQPGRQAARDPVRDQEIDRVLLEDAIDERRDAHSGFTMTTFTAAVGAALLAGAPWARARLHLSRAKPRSLQGHARIARWLARLVPYYEFDDGRFFDSDGAAPSVAARRRAGFARLSIALA